MHINNSFQFIPPKNVLVGRYLNAQFYDQSSVVFIIKNVIQCNKVMIERWTNKAWCILYGAHILTWFFQKIMYGYSIKPKLFQSSKCSSKNITNNIYVTNTCTI